MKRSTFFPAKQKFVELLVSAAHVRLLRGGIQDTVADVRERFWALKGHQTVKTIVHSCICHV
uniref:Integrase zinc-binding domain-containing protein n=1 Tax=Ixodes scapularis TaxID=6945 RepID=A0A1S4LHY6_IXOSC